MNLLRIKLEHLRPSLQCLAVFDGCFLTYDAIVLRLQSFVGDVHVISLLEFGAGVSVHAVCKYKFAKMAKINGTQNKAGR